MTVLPLVEDFQALATTETQPGVGKLMIGEDFRVYRKTRGLMEVICEVDPVDETESALYYGGVDWNQYPKMEWLADLYDRFLLKYDREVMFMVGKRYQVVEGMCPWFFMVNKQVGTEGSIEWEDEEGMEWFLERARFLGTVHIHSGGGPVHASGVDIGHWTEKECSGIHVVFGRDQSFAIYGSANGHCVRIVEDTVQDLPRKRAPLCHSRNKKLRKLLLVPPPVIGGQGAIQSWWERREKERAAESTRDEGPTPEWENYLSSVALATAWDEPALQSVGKLWLVADGRHTRLLDTVDYKRYRDQCMARGWDDAPVGICLAPVL